MKPRLATTVLLTRGSGDAFEIYLVERAQSLRFFGGFWAFPGGGLDRAEREDEDKDRALRHCTLRELFEETGVLLAPLGEHIDERARGELRKALLADADGAAESFRALVQRAPEAGDTLRDVCEMTTPPLFPVRFATTFFHAELPPGEIPTILPGELERGRFVKPAAALARWLAGEERISPPSLFLIEAWVKEPELETFFATVGRHARELDAGKLHPVRCSPGVFTAPLLTPTLPPATTTNTYVVGTDRLVLIDPATHDVSEQGRLFDTLDRRIAEGASIEAVLVTHHHHDHVGAICAVSERYDVAVHAHPLTLERLPQGFQRGRDLEDGACIELGTAPDGTPDWHLEALFTPGHDRGHLAFLESRYRALFAGDLVSTVSTIVIDPPEGHLRTYLASLMRVASERVETLYPAHGPPSSTPQRLLREYIRHRGQREEALVRALASGPRRLSELVREIYADVDPKLHGLAERSLVAGLEKLEEEGRAQAADGTWTLKERR